MAHWPNPACHLFLQIMFYWSTSTSIHLCIVYGRFCTTMVELSGERDHVQCKAPNTDFLGFFWKSCQPLICINLKISILGMLCVINNGTQSLLSSRVLTVYIFSYLCVQRCYVSSWELTMAGVFTPLEQSSTTNQIISFFSFCEDWLPIAQEGLTGKYQ